MAPSETAKHKMRAIIAAIRPPLRCGGVEKPSSGQKTAKPRDDRHLSTAPSRPGKDKSADKENHQNGTANQETGLALEDASLAIAKSSSRRRLGIEDSETFRSRHIAYTYATISMWPHTSKSRSSSEG
ncbi:hypothetical protein NUW58_g9978 [Xylaria curta]|uniref:Uncharacterized protein n=1 Tax=Xylaria curta TaxID=42375 RepID=A0ACC1MR40_9PEZI|nr:hypothetical protein NUW58_g9978 [Xylaria curta]